MNNAWDDLPNAKHIDRVLAHAKAYPDKWDAAWVAAWVAAWNAVRDASRVAVRVAVRDAAWDAVRVAAWNAVRDASRDASRDAARRDAAWVAVQGVILALMAYDDCAYMLEFTPEQIHLYTCLGIPAATLLEPAVKAMYNE